MKKVNFHIANEFPRISPITLHSISQTRLLSGIQAAKRKLSKVDETVKAKHDVFKRSFKLKYNLDQTRVEKDIKSREEKNSEDMDQLINLIKGRVHCFSVQIVINKCFLLNPEKKLSQICLVVFEKNAHFNSEK